MQPLHELDEGAYRCANGKDFSKTSREDISKIIEDIESIDDVRGATSMNKLIEMKHDMAALKLLNKALTNENEELRKRIAALEKENTELSLSGGSSQYSKYIRR